MKKIIAVILALALLCAVCGTLAEEPQFATFGDAVAAAGEEPVSGGTDEYMTVIVEKDGKFFRVVTMLDDEAKELDAAVLEAADVEAAFAAFDEYVRTLPVSYTEELTAPPKDQAELDALAGKTIADLEAAGYEYYSSGTGSAEDEIVFTMDSGLYAYDFIVDANFDEYLKLEEKDDFDGLKVLSGKFAGPSIFATELNYHADGTVEAAADDEDEDDEDEDGEAGLEELFGLMGSSDSANVHGLSEPVPDDVDGVPSLMGELIGIMTEEDDEDDGLPGYEYTGRDAVEGAIADALADDEFAEMYLTTEESVAIPCPIIFKTEMADDSHAKVYGNFWVMNYVLEGQTLKCISGGEAPGIITLEKEDDEWIITSMEQAGDGEQYAKDIEAFAAGDADLLAQYQESSDLQSETGKVVRAKFILDYVKDNGLDVTAYQDEGWDPVPLK